MHTDFHFINLVFVSFQGFDIPLLPGAVGIGLQMPNNLKRKKLAVFVARISKFALKYYNNKYVRMSIPVYFFLVAINGRITSMHVFIYFFEEAVT